MSPSSCRSSSARPSLVGSFGTPNVAPSATFSISVERTGEHGHRLEVDAAGVHQVRAVLLVVVVEVVDVLEVVRVERAVRGVAVGLDVVRVLLDRELDALLREQRGGIVVQDHGMGAGTRAHGERLGLGGGTGSGTRRLTGATASGERRGGHDRGSAGEDGTTGDGVRKQRHDKLLRIETGITEWKTCDGQSCAQ